MTVPRCSGLLLAALSAASVCAQAVPDAGSLRQQIEHDRELPLPHKVAPEKAAAPAAEPTGGGPVIRVKGFRFVGATLLTSEQLASIVAGYLDRPLDFAQLQGVAGVVANAYRQAGWMARAYLPQQAITDGIVTIQIVEALFGGIRRDSAEPSRVRADIPIGMLEARQKAGQALNAAAFDRALLLADDLPGIAVTGSLREGRGERETDLALNLLDEPLVAGDISTDNSGSRATGSHRLSGNVNFNSPLGLGELMSANVVRTDGSSYIRLGSTLPFGTDGWRIGASASYLEYRLVAPEFAALNTRGSSDSVGLEASYPIVRSRLRNLYLTLNGDHKRFDNQSEGATTTHYPADSLTIGLNGNLYDDLFGGGANSANLALVGGYIDLAASPNQAADAATTQTAGRYRKLRYGASRQQVLGQNWFAFAALSGQVASRNLDSSESFSLGGERGVRAYSGSEGRGAEGLMVNLELRWQLSGTLTLTGFSDWGRITVNHNNRFAGAPLLNTYSLAGKGATLTWQADERIKLNATLARRNGSNPNATLTGQDQDGTLEKNRLWLSASLSF